MEHISRKSLTQPYSKGGLNVFEFFTLNQIFKINWLKKCLKGNSIWFWIPNMIFKRCGNLQFLLSCDFKSTKLPMKLSNFHKQALDSWKLIFKHHFSPHIIWNNRYVLSARKSVFFPDWFSKGIVFISDLISNSGDFYTYVDFLNKYGINASKRDYTILTNSIPPKLLFLIKSYKIYCNLCLIIPRLFIQGVNIMDNKCTNKFLRNFVTANNASSFKAYRKWLALYPNVNFQKVWTVPNKFLFNNKIKEVHFKIIHHYYPCNKYLSTFIQNLSPLCSFCQEEEESLSHLFYFCPYTKQFWLQISASLLLVFFRLCNISAVKVLFIRWFLTVGS